MTDRDVSSIEEIAGINFEPWRHEEGEWTPPPNDEWHRIMGIHIVSVRFGWAIMYKSKYELMELFENFDDSELEIFLNNIDAAADFFHGLAELMRSAEARVLCAGASSIDDIGKMEG